VVKLLLAHQGLKISTGCWIEIQGSFRKMKPQIVKLLLDYKKRAVHQPSTSKIVQKVLVEHQE